MANTFDWIEISTNDIEKSATFTNLSSVGRLPIKAQQMVLIYGSLIPKVNQGSRTCGGEVYG